MSLPPFPSLSARTTGGAYFLILAVLCGLVAGGFIVNQRLIAAYRAHSLATLQIDQQRIDVQKIVLMATQLARAKSYRDRLALQPPFINLRLRYSHWVRSRASQSNAVADGPLNTANQQLLEYSTNFMHAVSALQDPLDLSISAAGVAHLADLLDQRLLPAFETVLAAQGKLADAAAQRMRTVEIALIAALLLALATGVVFIAWPIIRSISDQKHALRTAPARLILRDCINDVSGLANRKALEQHMSEVLKTPQDGNVLLINIEIDDFHGLTEDIGIGSAEEVQRWVGAGLSSNSREGDLIADLGSGEFMVLMQCHDPKLAEDTANRFKVIPGETPELDARSRKIRAHVGYFCAPPLSADASTFLHNAHLALNEARLRDSDDVLHCSDEMRLAAQQRDKTCGELASALEDGRIVAYFQPQLDLHNGSITGFEALARWDHPERGLLTPAHFLDVADRTGLAEPIGEAILAQSLQALNDWKSAGFDISSVGVNFSTNQLRDPGLTERIKWEVERHGVEPSFVAIEVLESAPLLPESDQIVRNIRALSGFGFQIDLDDFGTGSTSVGHIRKLGASRIKLDRSLVKELDRIDERKIIASALIRMSKAMHIKVLAEGVETDGELATLRSLGCDYVQGFRIARPMPFNATVPWLMARANGRLDAATGLV